MLGYERFMARPIIPNEMEIVVKPDEKQHHSIGRPDLYSDKYKPRNIYNPKEQVKGVCGWVMQILMQMVKKYSSLSINFAAGCSPDELSKRMTTAWLKLKDPVLLTWDGARHDSLQHIWFLRDVDNVILKTVIPVLCPLLGFTSHQVKAIMDNLTALWTDVTLTQKVKNMRKRKLIKLLEAKVFGTVFSGHPSRTTFGNTLRILFLSMYISIQCGIKWNMDMFHFQAGDDTCIIIERCLAEKFRAAALSTYKQYGLIMQDCKIDSVGEFLSRRVFFENGSIHLRRFEARVVQTGLYTNKVGVEDMPAFDKCITSQLSAWGSKMLGVSSFVKWRRKREKVVTKRSLDKVSEALKDQWSILEGSEQDVSCHLANEEKAYLLLDACLGNPLLSWIRNA
jgi:hypothetical protein